MKISLSTGCLYVYPLSVIFGIAKRAGFDGIELVISPEVDWRGAGYVRKLSEKHALPVLSVHPPLMQYPGWRGSFVTIVPFLERALKVTQEVNAHILVVHLPRSRNPNAGVGREFLEGVVAAQARLNGDGTRISLENRAFFIEQARGLILSMPEELRAFADEHDLPLTLDTAHLASWGLDLIESSAAFRGRMVNVHLSDLRDVPAFVERHPGLHSYAKQHQLPGAGRLPLREFLGGLARDGYDGIVTLELSPMALSFWNPRAAERKLAEAVQYVQRAIGRN